MFPDSPQDQEQVLTDIVGPSEIGRAYLDKIVRAGDYKDKPRARDLLYKAAAELATQMANASNSEEKVETSA